MSDGDFIPSLTDLLGQLDEEDCKDESNEPKSLVADPHSGKVSDGGPLNTLLSQLLVALPWELALPVGFFGWPLLEHLFITGLEERGECEKLGEWPLRISKINPKDLVQELNISEADISDGDRGEMAQQVLELQQWQGELQARLRFLEEHLAWKVLGISQTSDTSAIGKAFKRRALELHPDKGGDQQKFQLLQDMKGLLIPDGVASKPRTQREPKASDGDDGDDTDEEIEQLIRARRQVKESDAEMRDSVAPKASLSATRVKLHQAVVLAWDRFQDLGKKLAQFEPTEDGQESLEVLRKFQFFLTSFVAQHSNETKLIEQFLMDGADILLAAALLDADATSSCIAGVFGTPGSDCLGGLCDTLEGLEMLRPRVLTFWTSIRPDFVADAPADRNQPPMQQDGDPLGLVKANAEIAMMHERHLMPEIRAEVSNAKTEHQEVQKVGNSSGYHAGTTGRHGPGCVCTSCLRRRWGFKR